MPSAARALNAPAITYDERDTDDAMNRRRVWRRVSQVWIALGLLATVVFVGWSLVAYRASADARAAMKPDATVSVAHAGGIWRFVPAALPSADRTALVFFPGALVDPVAYAPGRADGS